MRLGTRERVKINAGLLAIHSEGYDPEAVTRVAEAMMNNGTPALAAYAHAFRQFSQSVPALAPGLQRIGQLVDATDDRTIAGYDLALTRYIDSGDPAALEPIAATVESDLQAMAERTGDAGFAEPVTILPSAPTPDPAPAPAEARSGPGWTPEGYRPSEAAEALSAPQ